jgi:hypothetical protein
VSASVIDGVEGAIDVEHGEIAALQMHRAALTWRQRGSFENE